MQTLLFPSSQHVFPNNHSRTLRLSMDFTCTCGASVSSPSAIERRYEGCTVCEPGRSSMPSSSATSGPTAPRQPTVSLRPHLNSPAHRASTPRRYPWRNSHRQCLGTPGLNLYVRLHLEAALTDVTAHNTQLQQTVEKHEATIKHLQQRLDELERNRQTP